MNRKAFAARIAAAVLSVAVSAALAQEAPEAVPAEAGEAVEAGQAPQDAGPRPLDEIAAVVNEDVITEFELQELTHMASLNLRRQGIRLPPMQNLRRQVLEQMILEKAVAQRAKELGIMVDDPMVSSAIEQIASANRLTVEQIRERLAQDGVTFQTFRDQVRREITTRRLREREVDSQIQIPESEIDAYIVEQSTSGGAEYLVSHILLPVESESEQEKVRVQAEDILSRAKAGEDFRSLAVSYSKAGDSMNGGELGWRTSQNMPTVLWEAVKNEPVRGAVAISQDSSGFHIVKITDIRNEQSRAFTQGLVKMTHARHILMQVSQLTPEATVVSRLADIRNKIVSGREDFQTMARLHSVDSSSTRGGDLGWMEAGDTVPEFERVMDSLPIGAVSEPVKSQFGYHLIQVLERKEAKTDPRRARMAARQALREKKLLEAEANWQRELRDRAYVEIRNPGE